MGLGEVAINPREYSATFGIAVRSLGAALSIWVGNQAPLLDTESKARVSLLYALQPERLYYSRENVKVDRVACLWLISKFIDPAAEFIFVPEDEVERIAREVGATPFDIDGCELGHHGEDVSFNSLLKKYHLHDPALSAPFWRRIQL